MAKLHRYTLVFLHSIFLVYLLGYAFNVRTIESSTGFSYSSGLSYSVVILVLCSTLATLATPISMGWLAVATFAGSKLYVALYAQKSAGEILESALLTLALAAAEALFGRLEADFYLLEGWDKVLAHDVDDTSA